MPRRGRPSTDVSTRPPSPAYRAGHEATFGVQAPHLGKSYRHTHAVVKRDPRTGVSVIERCTTEGCMYDALASLGAELDTLNNTGTALFCNSTREAFDVLMGRKRSTDG